MENYLLKEIEVYSDGTHDFKYNEDSKYCIELCADKDEIFWEQSLLQKIEEILK